MEIQLADGINILAVLGVGFWLHKEIAGLRERMAKLEGTVGGLQNTVNGLQGTVNAVLPFVATTEHQPNQVS